MRKITKNFCERILARFNYLKIKIHNLIHKKEREEYFAEMQRLCGLSGIAPEVYERARSKIFNDMVDKATATIKADSEKMESLKRSAERQAEDKIHKDDEALATAIFLEAKAREIVRKKEKFESDWLDYMADKRIIGDKQPNADDFADFLVSRKYLTENQLENMTVTALIVDNSSVHNFRDFDVEINRVKNS